MLPRSPRAKEINAVIDQQLEAITVFFSSKNEDPNFQPSIEGLRERMLPKHPQGKKGINSKEQSNSKALTSFFKKFLKEHTNGGRPLSQLTLRNYKTALASWEAFERHCDRQYSIDEFKLGEHEHNLKARKIIEAYQRFLIEVGIGNCPLSDNTARKRLKVLSTMFRWYETETGNQLIRKISIKGDIISKHSVSLTKDEVQAIIDLELL
jgi:hypothetical protein